MRGIAACHTAVKWRESSLSKLLRSPVYKGVRNYAGMTFECPVIIDPDTWDRVQVARADKARKYKAKVKPDDAICSAVFKCGLCGLPYYHVPKIERNKDGSRITRHYYICQGHSNNGPCKSKLVRCQDLDEQIWGVCQEYLNNPEEIIRRSMASDATFAGEVADLEQEEQAIRATLERIEADVKEAWAMQRKNKWPMSYITPMLNELNAEREGTLKQLEGVRSGRAAALVGQESGSSVMAYVAGIRAELKAGLSAEAKAKVVRMLIPEGKIVTQGEGRRKYVDVSLRLRWGEVRQDSCPAPRSTESMLMETITLTFRLPRVA